MTSQAIAKDISRVESERFDDSNSWALSEGVFKQGPHSGELDFSAQANIKNLPLNHDFFDDRIKKERALLNQDRENAKLLIRVGDIYFASRKYHKARTYYSRAFAKDTSNAVLTKKLVQSYLGEKKIDKADGVLNLISPIEDPGLKHLHGVVRLGLGQYEEAEKLFLEISKDYPKIFEVANSLGLVALIKKDYAAAESYFNESLKKNGSYSHAKNNLAIAYSAQAKKDEAEELYKELLESTPGFLMPYNNLFNLYVEQDKIQQAHELMLRAKPLIDQDIDIQFKIAWTLMVMEEYDRAISEYEKIFNIIPNNANTLNNIGFCHFKMGDYKSAETFFLRSIAQPVTTVLPYRNILVVYDRLANKGGLKKYSKRLLSFDKNDPYGLTYFGSSLLEEEDWKGALEYLKRALEFKPPLITLYLSLTFIYADVYKNLSAGVELVEYVLSKKIENYELIYNNYIHLLLVNERIDELGKIIPKMNDPEGPISMSTLALYHLKTGDKQKAIQLYDEAIEIVRADLKGKITQRKYYDLGNFYLASNDIARAKSSFEKAKNAENGYKYINDEIDKKSY